LQFEELSIIITLRIEVSEFIAEQRGYPILL